uniref:Uncharacterized protein n=1 Tax=Rhizophagus irregularis (strain DAOM 181602 / DAOM 197198 / MUCL 43194) TaxID=747089 RepID=U9SWY7_RHIID
MADRLTGLNGAYEGEIDYFNRTFFMLFNTNELLLEYFLILCSTRYIRDIYERVQNNENNAKILDEMIQQDQLIVLDSTVKVWDIEKGFCTHNFREHGGIIRFIEKKANFAQEERKIGHKKELFYTDGNDNGITIVLKLNVRNLRARETSHMAKKIFVHKAHKNLVYTSTHFVHRILFDKLGPVILHNYQPRCLKEQLINGKIVLINSFN